MHQNFPISHKETQIQADQYLLSKTDLKGRFIYANPAFLELNGFTSEDLLGKSHNIIRHPDMPAAAFEDMWNTLQTGKQWLGVIKNRRKDGGFYWTQALIIPLIENNNTTGYCSVHVQPTPNQIKRSSHVYEKINQKQPKGYVIKHGAIIPIGWRALVQKLKTPLQTDIQGSTSRLLFLLAILFLMAIVIPASVELRAITLYLYIAIMSLGFISAAIAGWHLYKKISTSTQQAKHITQQMTVGNLMIDTDSLIDKDINSHHVLLLLSMLRKGLSAIAEDTHAHINASLTATDKSSISNNTLALNIQHQTIALEQTTASIAELSITVRKNSDHAQQASILAERSMSTADQGSLAVDELIAAMKSIHHSSKEISDIVNVIDRLAFQSNILALNAAVESARAGDAGKGFAVVAGEVRNLAQRSAQAAHKIKDLIENSVEKVAQGAQQAEHAGHSMHTMMNAVREVNHIVYEIAYASSAQSAGLHQIHQAITQIDEITKQNSTLVNDLSQAIHQLSLYTRRTNHVIRALNTYKTSNNTIEKNMIPSDPIGS